MTDRPIREHWPFALLGAALLAFFVYPFLTLFSRTGSGSTAETLSSPMAQEAIRNSLVTAPISTAIATVLGVPLAYALARSTFRGKRLVDALVVLPLVLPPVVAGAMLLTGVGRFTTVGGFFHAHGFPLHDSLAGIVLAQTFVAAPFVVITSRAGFAAIDPRLEQASRSMGYGPLQTFRHVSLPLARGMILAGVVLTFVRAIGEFGATMMIANNPRTMPTAIWVTWIGGGVEAMVPLALVLLAISLLVVATIQFVGRVPTVGE